MSELDEYIYDDVEEKARLKQDNFPDPDEIEEAYDDILFEEKCKEVITLYNIENYWEKNQDWDGLDTKDKLEYCKSILQSIPSDNFPLNRQVTTFINLINIDLKKLNYYLVLECAFESGQPNDITNIKINQLLPRIHYTNYIHKLYATSNIKSLQIPLQNSTEFLQELFEIWCKHIVFDLNPYEISIDIDILYDGAIYEPKQIKRKLTAVRELIR